MNILEERNLNMIYYSLVDEKICVLKILPQLYQQI
jgi:hypothetical protein